MQPKMNSTIQDKKLPQLSAVLDAGLMKYVFEKVLIRLEVEECQIIQSRYKPERNCLISYRLQIRDGITNERQEQILCARVFPAGESLSRFTKAQKQTLVAPKFGNALTHLSDLEMVVWAFPNDRKLTGLPYISDVNRLRAEILPAAFGDNFQINSLSSEIIHYVAEHTCTVKVNLALTNVKTSKSHTAILYGKTYYKEEGAQTFQAMQELAKQVNITQPLAYQPEIKTLWQFGLQGKTLNEYSANDDFLAGKTAEAVAALHQAKVSCARQATLPDLLLKLETATKFFALNNPSEQQKLSVLVERLITQSSRLTARPTALLHGDLHLKNFFVAGDKVVLIDLDNLAYGDPLQDVGSFIAGLWYRGNSPQQINAFVEAYQKIVPWEVPQKDLNWYIVTMLIAERVYRGITRLKTGQAKTTEDIITFADQISGGQL